MSQVASITPIRSLEVTTVAKVWDFSIAHREDIERHWTERLNKHPFLFNGKVPLLADWTLDDGRLKGRCMVVDFKSFLYWRDHDAPDRSVFDFFAAGAIHSNEGWLILGRAGPAMSNAGRIYPPSGSFDSLADTDHPIDVDRSITREIFEETGLRINAEQLGPMLAVQGDAQFVVMRPINLPVSGDRLVADIHRHLQSQSSPELAEIVIVRGRQDIQPHDMPAFVIAYIEHIFHE